MSQTPKNPNTERLQTWDQEMEDLDEMMEASGAQAVPVSELLSQIEKLETTKLPDDRVLMPKTPQQFFKKMTAGIVPRASSNAQEDIEQLMKEHGLVVDDTPTTAKPQVEDPDSNGDDVYEESFASQHETAQLREDMETLTEKMESKLNALSAQFDLVMKERELLPGIINTIRADTNAQLTEFSDKLYTLLESQPSTKEIQSTLATVDRIKTEQSDQLRSAAGYLSSDPKPSSPLVQTGVSLKGKGKFKPIK